jgi:hypothetical protein
MMAFDSHREGAALDAATVSELREVFLRSLDAGAHGDELKAVLSRAAQDAKSKGMLAEQLLVTLKDIWYSLPPIAAHSGNDVQTRLLQQLVARCIQEYYAT